MKSRETFPCIKKCWLQQILRKRKEKRSSRFCGKEKRKVDKKDEKDWLRISFDWPFLIHVAICVGLQQVKEGKKRWLSDSHYYSMSKQEKGELIWVGERLMILHELFLFCLYCMFCNFKNALRNLCSSSKYK